MRLAATFAQGSRFHSSGEPETVEVVPADDNDMQPISDISHSSHEPHDIIHDEVNERELVYSGNEQSNLAYRYLKSDSRQDLQRPDTLHNILANTQHIHLLHL
jgi:hypothetical protein